MLPVLSQAQQVLPKFGYFNLSSLIKMVPEYAVAQKNIADLRAKYDAETKRSEDEFNKKYEEFLDGQRDFAPSILQKRQAELQDMMERNVAFKKESQRLACSAIAWGLKEGGLFKKGAYMSYTIDNELLWVSGSQ